MARRRTSSHGGGGFWDVLRFLVVIGIIALVVGYLYGTMALDFISTRQANPGRGLLGLFGYGSADEPAAAPHEGATQPPTGAPDSSSQSTAAPTTSKDPATEPPGAAPAAGNEMALGAIRLYHVQLGSFSVQANANRLSDQLGEEGFGSLITDGPPYKVWLGVAADKESLADLAEQLKSLGFQVFVAPVEVPSVQFDIPQSLATAMEESRNVLLQGTDHWLKQLVTHDAGDEAVSELVASTARVEAVRDQIGQDTADATQQAARQLVAALDAAVQSLQSGTSSGDLPAGHIELLQLFLRYQFLVSLLSR